MTREDAVKEIENIKKFNYTLAPIEVFDMAIKALEQEPCRVKNELNLELNELKPCDDAVSRKAVLDVVNNPLNIRLDEIIKNLPSVRPREQTGHWKRISMDRYTTHAQYWYECDKCGEHNLGNTDFCPYCGCRMVEPKESEKI